MQQPHGCAAPIEFNTGCASVGDWLITRRISDVAVCRSSASVRSRVFACTCSKRRAFSIAITAWSAKVLTSSISRSEKAIGSSRGTPKTPMACPSRM